MSLIDLAGPDAQSPLVMLEVRQLGGALDGPAGALSPMAHTGAAFTLNAIGITPTPAQADAVRIHLERLEADLRPHVTGSTYLNFLDLEGATPPRVRAAYSRQDWDRLTGVKTTLRPAQPVPLQPQHPARRLRQQQPSRQTQPAWKVSTK